MTAESFQAIIRGGEHDGTVVTFNPVAPGTPLKPGPHYKGKPLAFLGNTTDGKTGLPVMVTLDR